MRIMCNPAHPGEILRELVITPSRSTISKTAAALGYSPREPDRHRGLTISETADALGVSRNTLHRILKGDGAITAEMATRLETVFGKPDAAHWLRLQNAYDLWRVARKAKSLGARPIEHVL